MPRWEGLHPLNGLAELYWLTGEEHCGVAFERIWRSIARLHRHNNGAFSSDEEVQGKPYHRGVIETCCTVAWTALSLEILKLSGGSRVADELELTALNCVSGYTNASGRSVAYNTLMDGIRKASADAMIFQSRAGTPALNRCSMNGARGFGMVSDWALMRDSDGLVLS